MKVDSGPLQDKWHVLHINPTAHTIKITKSTQGQVAIFSKKRTHVGGTLYFYTVPSII